MDSNERSKAEAADQGGPDSAARRTHPLVGIGIAWAFAVAMALRAAPFSGSWDERLALSVGLAAPTSLIGFGVAYFVSLRRTNFRWKLGALSLILLVAILANFICVSLGASVSDASLERPAGG